MKRVLTTAASLAVCATAASAGGLERSAPSSAILFEDGEYAEFSISTVSPTVSGVFMGAVPGGDMAQAYQNWSFGYKRDFGENLAFALVVDQPFGADVAYPTGGLYPLAGSTAVLSSFSVNGMLRYRLPSNVSVYGGLRLQSLQGNIALSSPAGPFYVLDAPAEWDLGYALGVAYERPEIALRVALSYYSEITHTFGDNAGTPFDVVTPQSLNLEFQSGIAANTLLFGSIRWVDWTETEIAPADYVAGFGSPLVEYSNDTTTYTLGLGRKFNETWSGAVILGHEPSGGDPVGNLGPTDGNSSIGLAATWTNDNVKITGGVRYIEIGDATTTTFGSEFSDNHAVAAGIKLAVNF